MRYKFKPFILKMEFISIKYFLNYCVQLDISKIIFSFSGFHLRKVKYPVYYSAESGCFVADYIIVFIFLFFIFNPSHFKGLGKHTDKSEGGSQFMGYIRNEIGFNFSKGNFFLNISKNNPSTGK